jgi:hypothetical protein
MIELLHFHVRHIFGKILLHRPMQTPKLTVVITKVVSNTVRNKRKAIGTRRIFKSNLSVIFCLVIV